jgi:methylmalonyl-CoA mutase N-terminal domain/subunit
VERALTALCRTMEKEPRVTDDCVSADNTMPYILDCVRAYATVGEIAGAMKKVVGEYREAGVF